MSIKRYTTLIGSSMLGSQTGELVKFEDHAAEIAAKDAEISRLRKVVDAVKKLNAAKNGKDTTAAWEDIDDALAELDGAR